MTATEKKINRRETILKQSQKQKKARKKPDESEMSSSFQSEELSEVSERRDHVSESESEQSERRANAEIPVDRNNHLRVTMDASSEMNTSHHTAATQPSKFRSTKDRII